MTIIKVTKQVVMTSLHLTLIPKKREDEEEGEDVAKKDEKEEPEKTTIQIDLTDRLNFLGRFLYLLSLLYSRIKNVRNSRVSKP